MSYSWGLILCIVSFLFWVFVQNLFFDIYISGVFVVLFGVFLINIWVYTRFSVYFLIFSLIFLPIGTFTSFLTTSKIEANMEFLAPYYYLSEYSIKAQILLENAQWDYTRDYLVHIEQLWKLGITEKNIHAILRAPYNFEYFPWDRVEFHGKLYKIENFSWGDIENYYLSKNIYFRAYPYSIEVLSKNEEPGGIFLLKESFIWVIDTLFPRDQASLLWGILIGARSSISWELKDNFQRSWLTHIVAVSWFNITILLIFCSYLLAVFPRFIKILWVLWLTIFFVLLVWPSAPVVRSAIMGVLGYMILTYGRQANTLAVLMVSLFLMVLISPYSLNYDVSLHLSFFAVLWILLYSDTFKKLFSFVPELFLIRESLVMTFAALVLNIPILLWSFWEISIVAPLTNILVVWNIPFVMLFGIFAIGWYYIWHTLGIILWIIPHILLSFNIFIIEVFWSSNWSVVNVDMGEWKRYFMVGYWGMLLLVYFFFQTRS